MGVTSSEQMRDRWQRLAQQDAMWAIATRAKKWTPEEFFTSGRPLVEQTIAWADPQRGRMLEVGCGLGRTAVHFARHFQHADAIDISPAMIEQARAFNPPSNLKFAVANGTDVREFPERVFDFVASFLVFQHIPSESVIAAYLRETARVLKPAGRAVLQFDTRPRTALRVLYQALPDILLPRVHRRGLRRITRKSTRLRELIVSSNLQIIDEKKPDSADHQFLLTVRHE